MNGIADKVRIVYQRIQSVAKESFENGVAVYNMPHFGVESFNELDSLREDESKPSLLAVILERFPGIRWIIAAGENAEIYEKNLLVEAKRFGLRLHAKIVIPNRSGGSLLENTPESVLYMPTFVFEVPQSRPTGSLISAA